MNSSRTSMKGKVAIICGGSKGIGRATATEIITRGGSVCLVARNEEDLLKAVQELTALKVEDSQFIEHIACDTTDIERLKPLLENFIEQHGVPDYLINLVGYAYPEYVEKLKLEDFKQCMDVNYYGQLIPILVLLPYFKQARKGHIANVSSLMGFFGIMSYASYAPTKFAIVGLTESLRHELKPYNIKFSILYPPDTATPGYDLENRSKPEECKIMSSTVKALQPEKVARIFVDGILKQKYAILPGESAMLWRVNRYFPWLVRWITDRQYKAALTKVQKYSN